MRLLSSRRSVVGEFSIRNRGEGGAMQNKTDGEQPGSVEGGRNCGDCRCIRQPATDAAGPRQLPAADWAGYRVCGAGVHRYRRVGEVYRRGPGEAGGDRQYAGGRGGRVGEPVCQERAAALAICWPARCGHVDALPPWSTAACAIQRSWRSLGCRWWRATGRRCREWDDGG